MNHESTNDPIRPLLKAIDASVAKARARRLGDPNDGGGHADAIFPIKSAAQAATSTESTHRLNPDGTPVLKAKRKTTTSFDTPMPTGSIWDRKAG